MDLDGIDDAERKLEGELTGHRVGGIGPVHEQRALARACAIETEAPPGIADDARQEWQCLLKPVGWKLKDPQELIPDLILFERLASTRRGDHIDDLGQGGQGQWEPYVDRLTFEHQDGWMLGSRVP